MMKLGDLDTVAALRDMRRVSVEALVLATELFSNAAVLKALPIKVEAYAQPNPLFHWDMARMKPPDGDDPELQDALLRRERTLLHAIVEYHEGRIDTIDRRLRDLGVQP